MFEKEDGLDIGRAAEGANPEGSGSTLGPAVAKRARVNDSLENSGPAAMEAERDDMAPRRSTHVSDTRQEPVRDGAGADGAEGVKLVGAENEEALEAAQGLPPTPDQSGGSQR
jgi:hypothetical protein